MVVLFYSAFRSIEHGEILIEKIHSGITESAFASFVFKGSCLLNIFVSAYPSRVQRICPSVSALKDLHFSYFQRLTDTWVTQKSQLPYFQWVPHICNRKHPEVAHLSTSFVVVSFPSFFSFFPEERLQTHSAKFFLFNSGVSLFFTLFDSCRNKSLI